MPAPYWINSSLPAGFPPVELALDDPDGLLAVGGDLSIERLLVAYQHGIFPWYSHNQPILWWSPDPRMVLLPARVRVSRSLRKTLRQHQFSVTLDQSFAEVISSCAVQARKGQDGTWIVDDMQQAYMQLHNKGYAHSVEVWHADKLVGGLYGVSMGKVFFGESMFSTHTDASKVALVYLCALLLEQDFSLIDCQVYTPHLASLGAELIPREEFIDNILSASTERDLHRGHWDFPGHMDSLILATLENK